MSTSPLRLLGLLAGALLTAGPADAGMMLRASAWPASGPIDVFARVVAEDGLVLGLAAADFAVTIDGESVNAFTLAAPPGRDATQRLSLVLVVTDPTDVGTLISQLAVGDYASIVTFREDRLARYAPIDVQPFTRIDGGTGSEILYSFLGDVYRRDPEDMRPEILDLGAALRLAVDQFESAGETLPAGPRAIVLIKPNRAFAQFREQGKIVHSANALGLPIFTVYSGDSGRVETLRYGSIAATTGGFGLPAYESFQRSEIFELDLSMLRDIYRLSLPADIVTDCDAHTVAITVRGETESVDLTRCDTTPDDLTFATKDDVELGATVESDPVIVTGIEGPAPVAVEGGEVSVGCSTYTPGPVTVLPYESLCVRHVSGEFHDDPVYTTVVIGGVPALFSSTTKSLPPASDDDAGGGTGAASGGGGPADLAELLLLLGLLFTQAGVRRECRRTASGRIA
jgi:hypothetical protein